MTTPSWLTLCVHFLAPWAKRAFIDGDSPLQAIIAQREMDKIQNKRGIAFAGAWMNYAFHEDGFTAGLQAASYLPSMIPVLALRPRR